MNEMRELTVTELTEIEGGMMPAWLMKWLDASIGGATGGLCGYGPGGFEGPYHTVYKNSKGSNP